MNVLLVYMDCLRKDRAEGRMPKLAKLVRGAGWTTFTRHHSVAHCSDPNFLSILTGGYPDEHGVHTQMGSGHKKQYPTLQRRLQEAGYRTWAYEPVKVPAFYREGFDEVLYHATVDVSPTMAPGVKGVIQRSADGGQQWFGFMRVMDTHYPYNGEPLPKDQSLVLKQYDRAVSHVDGMLSHLLRWVLREQPDTLVVVGADHGELLGEDGLWDHLFTLRPQLVRVPLYVYHPGNVAAGCGVLTQHPTVTGLVLGATGLARTPAWEWACGRGLLDAPDALWLSAWGATARAQWKHKSVVIDAGGHDFQYAANWDVNTGGKSYDLWYDGLPMGITRGNAEAVQAARGLVAERYPTFPVPGPDSLWMMAASPAPMGDGEWA